MHFQCFKFKILVITPCEIQNIRILCRKVESRHTFLYKREFIIEKQSP